MYFPRNKKFKGQVDRYKILRRIQMKLTDVINYDLIQFNFSAVNKYRK